MNIFYIIIELYNIINNMQYFLRLGLFYEALGSFLI